MRKIAKKFTLLLVSLVVALVIGEVVVRMLGAGQTTLTRGTLHAYDPDAGWTCRPDLDARYALPHSFDVRVVCNSRGLRGPERPYAKPEGTRRVVVLGDSFMWGYGVEQDEVFASILERELPDTEAVNLGANGYSTVQELIRLEMEGVRYEPDWVVLSFTVNDLESNFDDKDGGRPFVEFDAGGHVMIANRPVRRPWKSSFVQWLRHNSRLFALSEYTVAAVTRERREQQAMEARATNVPPTEQQGAPGYSLVDVYGEPRVDIEKGWAAMEALVARIEALAVQAGGRLLVVCNGERLSTDPELWAGRFGDLVGDETVGLDWDRPARRLGDICARLEIPFLDLNPAFREERPIARMYLQRNDHWSAAGHDLAGRLVAARIGGQG